MIKQLTIAALLSAQLGVAAAPAAAAELARIEQQRMGAFGGVSLRVPLDSRSRDRQVRAGLALAPTLETRTVDGRSTRIGDGLEIGYRSDGPVAVSLAGRRLGAQDDGEDEDGGLSTGEIVLIGIGVVVVAAGVGTLLLVDALNDSSD